MSKRKPPLDDCPEFVSKDFCNERTERVLGKLTVIEGKVDGMIKEAKNKSHAIRDTLLSILSGAVIAALAYTLSHIH